MLKQRFSEVTIETLPPMRVACFRAVSRTPEEDAVKVLDQWASGAGIREKPRNFGFDVDVHSEDAESGLRGYELWYVVPPGVVGSGPVVIREFPGGRFAALTIHHPFEDPFKFIPAGWDFLHEWVVTHNLVQPGEMLCLEEVIERDREQDMTLYHPISG
jgi:DNA gyrase inhibitor GyrI